LRGARCHARSVWACAVDDESGEMRKQRISPKLEVVKWVEALPGDVEVAYEAGPTGFGLARSLIAAGVRCRVLASSKMDRPSGDRVKTDNASASGSYDWYPREHLIRHFIRSHRRERNEKFAHRTSHRRKFEVGAKDSLLLTPRPDDLRSPTCRQCQTKHRLALRRIR
jgi:hypothetical protein